MTKNHIKIVNKIKSLERFNKYEAALIFGSLARGASSKNSDVDTIIITRNNVKEVIIHPYINGVKLDLSFYSFLQFEKRINEMMRKNPEREPLVARSIILFDKTGNLSNYIKKINKVKPQKFNKNLESEQRFLMYHANNKVKRLLKTDPVASLYSMNVGINELIKAYYLISERWWLSNKKLLEDLKEYDLKIYKYLENFLIAAEVDLKYKYWKKYFCIFILKLVE